MKKNIQFLLLLIFISGAITSCKKMDFNYRQFIEDGETIYIAKADSLKFRGGKNKAEITWLLLSDPKVHEYKVYWNSRRDSLINTVQKTKDVDTVRILIEDLQEGTHEFEVFMFDKYGNSSVNSTTIGKVYGARYQNSLLNRTFRSFKRLSDNNVEINWMESEEQLLYSEIQYIDTNNELVRHIVETSAELDTLTRFPLGGTLELRTAFLPDITAIDTFYTAFQQITLE